MKMFPGFIYFVDKETGKITNTIDVGAIAESAEVEIKLHYFQRKNLPHINQ
jgi:hypothetical protein